MTYRHRAVPACTLAVFSLVLAGPAQASNVSLENGSLVVAAGPGEQNTITLTHQGVAGGGTEITVFDQTAPAVAGAGCTQAGPNTVKCQSASAPFGGTIDLGDGDDRATLDADVFGGLPTARGRDGNDFILVAKGDANLVGDEGNDELTAGDGFEQLSGGGGDDVLDGGPGGDTLYGGSGNDRLLGREGNDALYGGSNTGRVPAGVDSFDGGAGNDTIDDDDRESATVVEINSDTISGGLDHDVVLSYVSRVAGVSVDLREPRRDGERGEGDDLFNVEEVRGGDGDDRLLGDGDENVLDGGPGNDTLRGRGGDDVLYANLGDDAAGELGRDTIRLNRDSTGYAQCGGGRDRVDFYSFARDNPSRGKRRGPRISKTCERMSVDGRRPFKPTPTRIRPSGLITFGKLGPIEGAIFSLTRATPSYRAFFSRRVTSSRLTAQLPPDLARRARTRGAIVRVQIAAKFYRTIAYRFRVGG